MVHAPARTRVWVGDDLLAGCDWQQAGVWDLIHFALLDWLARDDHSTVTSPPLVGCSGLSGCSQEHGLGLALTLDVP